MDVASAQMIGAPARKASDEGLWHLRSVSSGICKLLTAALGGDAVAVAAREFCNVRTMIIYCISYEQYAAHGYCFVKCKSVIASMRRDLWQISASMSTATIS
jgi:hypothetical protein